MKYFTLVLLFVACAFTLKAQTDAATEEDFTPTSPVMSIKLDGGFGLGIGGDPLTAPGVPPLSSSVGQGVKLNASLALPIVMNYYEDKFAAEDEDPFVPFTSLELVFGTGYHIMVGGVSVEQLPDGSLTTTKRSAAFIPLTFSLVTRANVPFGAVYVGAGVGLFMRSQYKEDVTNGRIATNADGSLVKANFTRELQTINAPFGFQGIFGVEFPIIFSLDGADVMDLYLEGRIIEVSQNLAHYTIPTPDGGSRSVSAEEDPSLLSSRSSRRVGTNIGGGLGFRFNF